MYCKGTLAKWQSRGLVSPSASVRLPPKDIFNAEDLMPALSFRILAGTGATGTFSAKTPFAFLAFYLKTNMYS